MTTYKKATVTYSFLVGVLKDEITVSDQGPVGRTRDDWIINLAIRAGQEVSKKHDTGLSNIVLKLVKAELE